LGNETESKGCITRSLNDLFGKANRAGLFIDNNHLIDIDMNEDFLLNLVMVPNSTVLELPVARNKSSTGGTHTYDRATIEWDWDTNKYYAKCKDVRYPIDDDSLSCVGHVHVWSEHLDNHGCYIHVIRGGRDRYYSAKGFLPFKNGHVVCGRIVSGFGGKKFDIVVNATALQHDNESIQAAYSFMKRLRNNDNVNGKGCEVCAIDETYVAEDYTEDD
jgi:hypothetical protein